MNKIFIFMVIIFTGIFFKIYFLNIKFKLRNVDIVLDYPYFSFAQNSGFFCIPSKIATSLPTFSYYFLHHSRLE